MRLSNGLDHRVHWSLLPRSSAEGIGADPDLASLHDEPAFRALVKARL